MSESALVEVVVTQADWPAEGKNADGLIKDWEVEVGATVQEGDLLGEAVIVKTALEVVAPVSGVVQALLVEKGKLFKPDMPLATIEVTS